jgi:hypothetical protein
MLAAKGAGVQKRVSYNELRPAQKAIFLVKLVICIASFGMIFPNLGD